MVAAILASCALAGSIPTIWSVNVEQGEYVISRWDNGKVRKVYTEPFDINDNFGPRGSILELWPTPRGNAIAFYKYLARGFSADGRGEERLTIFEPMSKRLSTIFSDRVLPPEEDILGSDYFQWSNETDYRVAVLFPYDKITVNFASLDPKKWNDDVHIVTGHISWKTYFERFRKKTWAYESYPPIPKDIDMMGEGVLRLTYPKDHIVISNESGPLLTLKPNHYIREIRYDGDRWLTITTYDQVVIPVGGFHIPTGYDDYKYRSYAIDWITGKIVYENDAYLMRIRPNPARAVD